MIDGQQLKNDSGVEQPPPKKVLKQKKESVDDEKPTVGKKTGSRSSSRGA